MKEWPLRSFQPLLWSSVLCMETPHLSAFVATFVHNLSFQGVMPLTVLPFAWCLRWEKGEALCIWVLKSVLKFACLSDNINFKHILLPFQMYAKVIREVTSSLLWICCFYFWEINILARILIGLLLILTAMLWFFLLGLERKASSWCLRMLGTYTILCLISLL